MSLIVPVIYILTHFRPISTRFPHPTPEILLRNECMEMMAVECNRRRTRGGNRVLKYRDEECAVTKLLRSFSLYNVISVPFSFHLTFRQAFGSRWTVLNEMHEANINPIRSRLFDRSAMCISSSIIYAFRNLYNLWNMLRAQVYTRNILLNHPKISNATRPSNLHVSEIPHALRVFASRIA